MYAIRDDSPLTYPDESSVVRSQPEPGLMLYACTMTGEGICLLCSRSEQDVAVINSDKGDCSAKEAAEAAQTNAASEPLELPEEELNSEAACEVGKQLCQKRVHE